MQDNTNKTTQELFDKLMLGFSKHFEKSSRRLDDDFEYEIVRRRRCYQRKIREEVS